MVCVSLTDLKRLPSLPSSDVSISLITQSRPHTDNESEAEGEQMGTTRRGVKRVEVAHREVLSNQGHRYPTVYSPETVSILQKWFDDHKLNPYPTAEEKAVLAVETGQTIVQVLNLLGSLLIVYRYFFLLLQVCRWLKYAREKMALESLKREGKRPAQLKASKEYPKRAVLILNTWFEENSEVLYPDRPVKEMLAEKTGLTSQQV